MSQCGPYGPPGRDGHRPTGGALAEIRSLTTQFERMALSKALLLRSNHR
jgi:hypothetical protein